MQQATNALQVMDRYQKELIQVSTLKNDKKVQYLYDKATLAYFIGPSFTGLKKGPVACRGHKICSKQSSNRKGWKLNMDPINLLV